MVGVQINLFIKIAHQIIDYLNCPKPLQQGFNYAMHPIGYSLYNQKCFDAYLSVFNKVPGQPTCTLVNLLPKFKLDPTYTVFNLSGAGATGEQIADLLLGLHRYQPTIHLTQFDLSHNAINTESGMKVLFEALKNITRADTLENGIKTLNLSRNAIGVFDDAATLVLGHELKYFPNLQTLDLTSNQIGNTAEDGTIAIGESLKYLTKLQSLGLAFNQVGYTGEDGTIAVGGGLKYLPNLQTLDLSENAIGRTGDNGTTSLGEGLKHLPHLQILDLSWNGIGKKGDNGTIAIGESLKYLSNLQILNLSENEVGHIGDSGTIAIGEGLKYLPHLQTLDLSANKIGLKGSNGTITIGEGLKYLSNLQTLGFSWNEINLGFSNLVDSITKLTTLKSLFIQQGNGIVLPFSQRTMLQRFWNHRNTNTDVYALLTLQDVQAYLDSLSNNTKVISLSKNFPDPPADLVTFLFNGITRFHDLQILDLSWNRIGDTREDGTVAIGHELKYLSNLQILNLSQNQIGNTGEDGTMAIGEGLEYLPSLQVLDISWGQIGYTGENGTIAIGEGLKYLTNLQTLNLSGNAIGRKGDNGTISLGKGLKYLPHLQILDLSWNGIGKKGENGTIAIGGGFKYLTNLHMLDLSVNEIGNTGDSGMIVIGEELKYLPNLQTLNLRNNYIGRNTENGPIAIGEGLKYLSNLQTLDLSSNQIGFKGDNGLVAIGEGLKHLSSLQILDLSGNEIGGSGAQSLFQDLPQVICQGLKTLNLQNNNFTDIPWGQAAKALEGLYSVEIRQACEANRCFGTPIAINTTAIKCGVIQSGGSYDECPPLSSSASSLSPFPIFKLFNFFGRNERTALPYLVLSEEAPMETALVPYQPVQPPSCWESLQDRFGWRSCHTQAKGAFSSSSTNLFLTGALKGAASTFVLEMMRDGLEHKQVSRHVSHKALMLTQAGFVIYTTTSLIPTMVGMAVNSGLTSIGVSSPISAALGSTVAIATSLINGDVVTPIGLAASLAGGLAGSMLALRVKNKFSSWLWGGETTGGQISTKVKTS